MTTDEVLALIREAHRDRRYAMKLQQKIDRAMESHVRVNKTEWEPDLPEPERKKINAQVGKIIDAARAGKGEPALIDLVTSTDASRAPADRLRKRHEGVMEKLVRQLPIFEWVEQVRGVGGLGLATIIAETGDLNNYANPARVWKRLGFAPYRGFAGSSWKIEKWRPEPLTKDEWIALGYSGSRYALMSQVALWLVNAQWIGEQKDEATGEVVAAGRPNGHYGEVYAKRRAHTAMTHPDWSKGHARKDALRITMKAFLKDLWREWRIRQGQIEIESQKSDAVPSEAGQQMSEAQIKDAGLDLQQSDQRACGHQGIPVGSDAAGHSVSAPPRRAARRVRKPSKNPEAKEKVSRRAKLAVKPKSAPPPRPSNSKQASP